MVNQTTDFFQQFIYTNRFPIDFNGTTEDLPALATLLWKEKNLRNQGRKEEYANIYADKFRRSLCV